MPTQSSVVSGQMTSNQTIPGFQAFYKVIAAGDTNISLGLTGASGLLFVYESKSGHSALFVVSSFGFNTTGFIKSSDSSGNLFSLELTESGKIGVNRTGVNADILVSNNTTLERNISGFFLKRT